jgi:hypothetical protein
MGGEVVTAPPYTPQLRPLSIGEVLDAGFRLVRQRLGTLVMCVLVPVVPLTILGTILIASTDDTAFDPNAPVDDSGTALAGTLISFVLQSAALALAVAACFKAVSAAYLGEDAGAGESLRYSLGRIVPLIIAYIVVTLVVVVGLVLLIIPGVFLAVKMSMTFAAVVFERKGPFGSIGRSFSLTKGHWWRTFGTLVIVFLLLFVINLAATVAFGAGLAAVDDANEVVVAVISTLINIAIIALTYPLWAAVVTVMYYDFRVRNEGFDLELLARGVGSYASRFATSPERPAEPQPAGGGFAPPQVPPSSA